MSAKCECGCGQASAATTRLRKAECDECGYVIRVTREWIARGLPLCPCGEPLALRCLEDRCCLPGDAGQAAGLEAWGKAAESERRSMNARKAARLRRRCKCCPRWTARGELYCPDHTSEGMPF